MRRLRTEVLVVGGGPAGAAAAAELARRGRDVIVAEAAPGPRDRVCGEFLSAESRPLLERLGLVEELRRRQPAAITHARFTAPGGAEAIFPLPASGSADGGPVGIRRRALDEALLRRAEQVGAVVLRGVRFRAPRRGRGDAVCGATMEAAGSALEVEARILVGADGRASRVACSLGLDAPAAGPGRCAVKAHFRRAPGCGPDGTVEVHLFHGGYVGIAPVEDGLVNVSAVIDAGLARQLRGGALGVLLGASSRSPAARERLSRMAPASRPQSLYPLERRRTAMAGDGFLLAGDAAAVVPPFTGDGITAAIRSGILAAETAEGALARDDCSQAVLGGYARARRNALEPAARAGRALERLMYRPALAAPVLALLGSMPGMARALVRATRVSP